jgi:hypothetical protein
MYYLDDKTTGEVLKKANEAYQKGAEIEVLNMNKNASMKLQGLKPA